MNQLPAHRQIIHGRTHARSWSAAEMDPIEGPSRLERMRWLHSTARRAELAMLALAAVFVVLLCARLA